MNWLLFVSLTILFCYCISQNEREIISGFAEVNGTRLYYEVGGAGETIVFIHGNGVDIRQWDGQFEKLSKHYRVIRYDVRGFGKSAVPVLGETYSHHVDLKRLLKKLGLGLFLGFDPILEIRMIP